MEWGAIVGLSRYAPSVAVQLLRSGATVAFDREGELIRASVTRVSPTARHETVYNVILGDLQIFIAGGFLVRSKPPGETAGK
jgi:hypothetical protein